MDIAALPRKRATNLSSFIYWLLCAAFCGLYLLRDVVGIGINYYIIYVLAAIIVLVVPKEYAIAFVVSIASFSQAGFNGAFSILLLACVAFKFLQGMKRIKLYSLLLLAMALMECMHYFSTGNGGFGSIITYAATIMVLIIIQQYPHEKINKKLLINSFIIFSLFFIMVTVIRLWMDYGSLEALIETGFRADEFEEIRDEDGLTANQNYITELCSINLGLCALMISKKMPKLPYLIAMVIFTVVALLTISKMFIAVIAAFIVYVVFITMKNNVVKGIGVLAVFAVAVTIGINLFGENLISMVMDRFETGTLSTGRVEIIEDLLAYMKENPITYIWGMGIMQPYYYIGMGVHSSVFEVFGGWGMIGLFIVLIYLICLILDSHRSAIKQGIKITGFNYLPLLMLLGYSLIGMLFSSAYGLIKMMVVIYAIQLGERKKA